MKIKYKPVKPKIFLYISGDRGGGGTKPLHRKAIRVKLKKVVNLCDWSTARFNTWVQVSQNHFAPTSFLNNQINLEVDK